MLGVSYVGIGFFKINPYIIVALLIVSFFYIIYKNENEMAIQSELESKQLVNKLKTKNSDVYLKHKQLLTMAANLPMPLALLDVEGKIVLYNSQFEKFREEINDDELTYTDNDLIKDVQNFVSDSFIFETALDKEMNIDGIEYQAMSVPITTNGNFSGCVVLFQDISRAKEKEEMQKQFIADASHELKTPISAIKGMVEILNREEFKDSATKKEFLIQIEKENQRLELIVKDLLQLSKLSNDSLVLKREIIDFTKIIDLSFNSLEQVAAEKGIKIEKEYHSHEGVFVDVDKMEVLVNNLLSNAIHYSEEGVITLKTSKEGDTYTFEIVDQGRGIPLEEQEKIFERFYRVDQDRSRVRGGSGLGLAIVKSIVDAHNASIVILSEENKGTAVQVKIKY